MKNSRKNLIWNIIGVTLYGLVSLALLIIVKSINGLGTSGVFSYAYSLGTLFLYIALYYSRTYQISNHIDKSFNDYFSFRILSNIISIIIIFLFTIISGFNFEKIMVIMLIILFRSVDSISDTFYGYLQSKDKLYHVGISYTLKSLLGVIAFLIIDLLTNNLYLSIISFVSINVLFLLMYDYRKFRLLNKDKIKIEFSSCKDILKNSFSVFIFSLLAVYLANAEKYIIVYYTSDELQSIFAMLIMPATIMSLVGNYIISPFITSLDKYNKEKNYISFGLLVKKILLYLLTIGVFIVVACYFIGIPALNIIYSIDLSDYKFYLLLVITAAIFNASSMIISNVLTIMNKNVMQVFFYLISGIIATIVCLIWKNYDIYSACYAYLISYLVNFVLYFVYYMVCIVRAKKANKKSMHTFVICAYKEEKNLEYCVQSLLNQTLKSEIIISTSTPNDFVKKISKQYGVRLEINTKTTGHINDFQYAYDLASTKYVTLCHQDDMYGERFAELTVKKMNKCEKPLIAFTNYYELKNDKLVKNNKVLFIKKMMNFPLLFFKKSRRIRLLTMSMGNSICSPTITYNKEMIKEPIVKSEFVSNLDWITYITFAKMKGEFVYIRKPLLTRRIHKNSLTTKVIQNNIRNEEDLKIFKMFWPDKIAKLIHKFYSKSEKYND